MNNAQRSVFPISSLKDGKDINGLTKREFFAMAAMQARLNGRFTNYDSTQKELYRLCVEDADGLLAELERTEHPSDRR